MVGEALDRETAVRGPARAGETSARGGSGAARPSAARRRRRCARAARELGAPSPQSRLGSSARASSSSSSRIGWRVRYSAAHADAPISVRQPWQQRRMLDQEREIGAAPGHGFRAAPAAARIPPARPTRDASRRRGNSARHHRVEALPRRGRQLRIARRVRTRSRVATSASGSAKPSSRKAAPRRRAADPARA